MRAIDRHRREAKLLPGRLARINPGVDLQIERIRPLARICDGVSRVEPEA
jgi:hypothetical protein